MADPNPFDQFDAAAPSPAQSGNPFDQFDQAAPPAPKPGPLHQFGEIGRDINRDAEAGLDTFGRGVQGIMHPDPTIHERLGSLADIPLGMAEYIGSPISGASRAVVGDPLEQAGDYAGLPPAVSKFAGKLGETAAGILGPGLVSKTAGETAAAVKDLVPRRPEMARRVEDFERAGITPNMPAIAQNKGLSTTAKVLGDTPIVGAPINEGIQKNISEAAASTRNIASQFSPEGVGLPEEGGEALQQGYNQFKYGPTGKPSPPPIESAADVAKPTRQVGFIPKSEALYDKIPIDGQSQAHVGNTTNMLDGLRMQFASNPNLNRLLSNPAFERMYQAIKPGSMEVEGSPLLNTRTELGRDPNAGDFLAYNKNAGFSLQRSRELQPTGGLSWQDLKNFRSYVGRQMRDPNNQLGVGPDEWKALYGAASRDLEATAAANGPDALKAFSRATNYYSAGLKRFDDVLNFLDKADSPEQAYYGLTKMASAQGKSAAIDRFNSVLKSMPDEFRDDVAATVIRRLGLPKPSVDGMSPDKFSLNTWGTNYASISDKAKEAMFGPVGTDRRDSLESLSNAVTALKNVERLANPSGSGRYRNAAAAATGLYEGMQHAPASTMVGAAISVATPYVLMSPTLTRWLANSMKVQTTEGWSAQLARLNKLAKNDPAASSYAAAVEAASNPAGSPDALP